MQMVRSIGKELVSSGYSLACTFVKRDKIQKSIKTKGFYVSEGFLSHLNCDSLADLIDSTLSNKSIEKINVWTDGADNRIYGFESIYDLKQAGINVHEIAKEGERYLGMKLRYYTTLAARIDFTADNYGSGGGWHRDSAFRHQFKAIIYLSDVDIACGPFQYIEGSHSTISKLRVGLFGSDRTRFSEEEIESRFGAFSKTKFVGKKGTCLMVDTRGVHRGAPLLHGKRYALTFYFYPQMPPKHLHNLTQHGISAI